MLRNDEVEDVLEVIETHFGDRLTDWEIGFIENIQEAPRPLSPGRLQKLDEIFERVSNHGKG